MLFYGRQFIPDDSNQFLVLSARALFLHFLSKWTFSATFFSALLQIAQQGHFRSLVARVVFLHRDDLLRV